MITRKQFQQIENWLFSYARPIEIAKWNLLFNNGTRESLLKEMLAYQNIDGGFGNGIEPDILTPDSGAVSSVEAIFISQDFGLDLEAVWAQELLHWFEKTADDTPAIWERVPSSLDKYPHAPWWDYSPNCSDSIFKPFPNAVVASALFSGTKSQQLLGHKVAEQCIRFLFEDETYDWYDTNCLQRLFIVLLDIKSPLITNEVIAQMNMRVVKSVCIDQCKWPGFVAQPLDSIDSPNSYWYKLLMNVVKDNLDFWEKTLLVDGYWPLNFSWGGDTEVAQSSSVAWKGYTVVKRMKTLKAFNRIEK